MTNSLPALLCPFCGSVVEADQSHCSHVRFVYSFDRAQFHFLSPDLAAAIAQADQQQAGCADAEWQSPPELAQNLLLQRPQAAVLDLQWRLRSWAGWLVGVEQSAIAGAE